MKLNKDGSPDMRFAENRNTRDRKQRRAILLAILLGALFACAIVTFLTRPRVANEYIFDTDEVKQDYIDTQAPENFYEHIKLMPTVTPIVPLENTDVGLTYTYRMRYINWQDAAELIGKECGFDPGAINPSSGACGLAQALPCTKMGCSLADINCQLDWQWEYVANKYGTITKALAFHRVKGWY